MQDITIIEHFVFTNLLQKIIIFLGIFLIFFSSLNSKIMGMNMTMDFYGKNNAPMYGVHTNEEIEQFINMYISYDVSLLPNPLQNAQ